MTWATVAAKNVGDLIGGDDWSAIKGNFDEIGGAWTGYSPTLGGTGWAVGNGTVDGAYRLLGKRLEGRAYFQFGSTSTAGAGGATFTIPTGTTVGEPQMCACAAFDDGADLAYGAAAIIEGSATVIKTSVTSSLFTFATSDLIVVKFGLELT